MVNKSILKYFFKNCVVNFFSLSWQKRTGDANYDYYLILIYYERLLKRHVRHIKYRHNRSASHARPGYAPSNQQ